MKKDNFNHIYSHRSPQNFVVIGAARLLRLLLKKYELKGQILGQRRNQRLQVICLPADCHPGPAVESFKYLGTEVDTHLDFKRHTDSTYNKAQHLYQLRKLRCFSVKEIFTLGYKPLGL